MAGSGRGRGRAAFTFNIEAIGFSKGASLPDAVCKPPPPFPVSTSATSEHALTVWVECIHFHCDNRMKYKNNPKHFRSVLRYLMYFHLFPLSFLSLLLPVPLLTVVSHS